MSRPERRQGSCPPDPLLRVRGVGPAAGARLGDSGPGLGGSRFRRLTARQWCRSAANAPGEGEPVPAAARQRASTSACQEGAMTASPARPRSRLAGALLGTVVVLLAGCTAAGGASTPRAEPPGPARHSVAASRHGRVVAPRTAGTPAPGRVTHGSRPKIAGASPLAQCAPPVGDPVVGRAGAVSRPRVAVPACLCCRWCACAWACCGCGTSRWPPRWWPRSRLAWPCCPRLLGPPEGDSSPIWPTCGPGCASGACPVERAGSAAGAVQGRAPGGAVAGAS